MKLPVHVRMFPAEIAAALSQQSYGAAFSRAEALRIAAMEWLKERQARQARGTPAPCCAPASTPKWRWPKSCRSAAIRSGAPWGRRHRREHIEPVRPLK